jgi:hypothetical protein
VFVVVVGGSCGDAMSSVRRLKGEDERFRIEGEARSFIAVVNSHCA